MYWLERNISQEQDGRGHPVDEETKAKLGATTPDSQPLGACSKKLGDIWSLRYVTSACPSGEISSKTSSLRRVSFAPCDQAGIAGPSSPARETADTLSYEVPSSSDDKDCAFSQVLRVPSTTDDEVLPAPNPMLSVSDNQVLPVEESQHVKEILCDHFPDSQVLQTLSDGMPVPFPDSYVLQPMGSDKLPVPLLNTNQPVKLVVRDGREHQAKMTKKTAKSKAKSIYYLEPRLPPRNFLPPSPPPDVSHYRRPTNPLCSEMLDRKTQSDDDCLSYHIKKKLLALKLQEKARKKVNRERLMGVSSPASSLSDINEDGPKVMKLKKVARQPIFHSTPDSVCSFTDESNPTLYYTPNQSMQNCYLEDLEMPVITSSLIQEADDGTSNSAKSPSSEGSVNSGSTRNSLNSSNSAPSFLISSSTQLCQCIGTGQDDSSDKFKTVLDKLTNVRWSPKSNAPNEELSGCEDPLQQEHKLSLVDESWWEKFERSYPEEEDLVDDDNETSANVQEAFDPSCGESEVSSGSGSPEVTYQKIDLEDLLSQIYPEVLIEATTAHDYDAAKDGKLEDLVDFLCGEYGEPGDVTTYTQKEMSLDCNDDDDDDDDNIEGGILNEDSPDSPSQHISIEMPEDSSFYNSMEANVSEAGTPAGEATIPGHLYPDFLTGDTRDQASLSFDLTQSAECSKLNTKAKGSTSPFCDDLIDISYEPEGDSRLYSFPDAHASEIWDDISAEFLTANQPNNSSSGEDSNISQLNSSQTSQGSLDLSLDDILNSTQQKITLDFKRSPKTVNKTSRESGKDSLTSTSALNSLVMDSLCSATDILKKSHDSLAKSMYDLCRRAIIKKSNISLELVLPSEKQQAETEEGVASFDTCVTTPSPQKALNVQLNSSIMYPSLSEEQTVQKVKRD